MSNWIIHFLISNIFICIFTLVIIGTKKLLKKYLSATTQYHLCFLLFLLLAVPFFPVQIHGSQLFSWLHFFCFAGCSICFEFIITQSYTFLSTKRASSKK